ncbi:MAG: cytochrome-c oxidase, cbb3-type subunit III [Gammaproteobacteria bacterium]|jgi:cytochrome c oxidase cbb3-type subunit 3|nr:cytochrome-c oxidase, cbb3-type subunit III [Gammaproteobacteria bacterium]
MAEQNQGKAVQTTGHAWDGDLQEFNNPLPRWWLWTFYATCVFALVYWIWYPAWPIADTFTKGIATVTYQSNGKEVTTHWNTRAELIEEMQTGDETLKQQAYLGKVAAASYEEIANDPDMMAFTRSMAKVLFADNCAACHGIGGTPALVGLYPNLSDDAWLWGGEIGQVEHTIKQGRNGYMPSFGAVLGDEKIDQLAHYVMTLSGQAADSAKAEAGREIFQGQEGGCHYCHTPSGKGMFSQGAANLTDAVWTVADVHGAADDAARLEAVRNVIKKGVSRQMPAWKGRLDDAQIKLLTVYVQSLGG